MSHKSLRLLMFHLTHKDKKKPNTQKESGSTQNEQ